MKPFAARTLVPRSLFLDSKLWADFNSSSYDPLSSATLYGEDLTAENLTEGVAGLMAGNLTCTQAADMLDRLLQNSTNDLASQAVDVTAYAPLLNLPTDALQIVPWEGVVNGPTGSLPATFWEKVGAAATALVNGMVALGQLIYGGLVALGNFLVALGEAIAAWGMALVGTVQAALQEVQAALEKVGEVLSSLTEWLTDFVDVLVRATLAVFVEPLQSLITGYMSSLALALLQTAEEYEKIGRLSAGVAAALDSALTGTLFWVLLGITGAVHAAFWALLPFTFTFSWVVTLAASLVVAFLVVETLGHSDTEGDVAYSLAGYIQPSAWTTETGSLIEAQPEWTSSLSEGERQSIRLLLGSLGFLFSFFGVLLGAAAVEDANMPFSRGQIVGSTLGILAVALTVAVLGGQGLNADWVFSLAVVAIFMGIGSLVLSGLSVLTLPPGTPKYLGWAGLGLGIVGIGLGIGALLI